MPAIVSFPDWAEATGPLVLTGPDKFVNAAALQNYSWAYFMRGKPLSETVQGGSEIRDDLMFDEANTFGFYQPNDPQSPTMPQVLTRWSGPWRFAVDSYSWTEEEETLNAGSQFTDDARFQQYKNLLTKLEMRVQTSITNGMETAWWAVPHTAQMETTTGKNPYSLPAFINEQTNTLFGSQTTAIPGGAWATVEGIDPTAAGKTKWRNQIIGYDSAAAKPTGGARNVINAFDDAYLSLRYRPPATKEAYFEGDTWNQLVSFTSKKGMLVMTDLLRQGQDWYTNRQNPDSAFLGPAYAGVEMVYVPALDSATLYKNATTGVVTEGNTNSAGLGPRFYLVNATYLKTVFHGDKYFVRKPPMSPFNQPFSKTVWINVYFNNICRGRQFNAIITPGTVAGAFPSQVLTQTQPYAAY